MPDYTPINIDNSAVTLTAGAVVSGGRVVKVGATDDSVIHTVLTTDRPIGVAAHDAPSGGRVTVYLLPGFLHELLMEPGAVITAGLGVQCSTTPGFVTSLVFSTSNYNAGLIGVCIRSTVTATGTKVRVLGL